MNDQKSHLGIPAYLDESKPKIADPAIGAKVNDWHPANDSAIKLVRCLEAIRDLSPIFRFLATLPNPENNNRFVKSIATPLYSLAESVRDVYGEIENSRIKGMRKKDRRVFLKRGQDFLNAVFHGKNSPLRTVRNKISAHIDKDTILGGEHVWKHVNLRSFVNVLRLCLNELDALLQQDIYAWTRNTDHPDLVRLMSVDGTLVDLVRENGELEYISAISFVKSPREAIAIEVNEFVAVSNLVVSAISRQSFR